MKEPTIRARHYAPACRMLEQTYALPAGSVYYIDLPYEPQAKPVPPPTEPARSERGRGKKRRKL